MARPQHSPRSRLNSVTGQKNSVCVTGQTGLKPPPVVAGDKKVTLNLKVDFCVANAHIVTGLPQRKGINPNCCQMYTEIKYVKDVSCVGHLSSVNLVTNAPPVVTNPPVHRVTQVLGEVGSSGFESKSSRHTERGLYPPLLVQTKLDQVTNCNKQLPQSSQTGQPFRGTVSAGEQKCSRTGRKSKLSGFLQPAILVPKPNNRWKPILDLSTLNTFLNTELFKMETPETIRTSLQAGEWVTSIDFKDTYFHIPIHNIFLNTESFKMDTPETIRTSLQVGGWVTSIDFKDAYFHIPIHSQSRKYMRFHLQGRSYQFKALPFGFSTAPMEFTVVTKEVKFMALQRGIRIHQYLDDWLVEASSHETCLQHTQTLVVLCQDLGWLVNKEKSELVPKQVCNFIGYQFDLKEGKVRPTPERWQALIDKIQSILSGPVCPVRHFVSLIGLLTATEKQVHLGRLHMRPIQWHLKNNWRVPESLDKVIPVPRSLHPHLRW